MSSAHRRPKAPYCWQEKNNLRHIRGMFKTGAIRKSEGRNMLDVFRAITEMLSDNTAGSDLTGTNLAKRLASYALMGTSTVKRTLALMEQHGVIAISQIRDEKTGRYSETRLALCSPPLRALCNADDAPSGVRNPPGGLKSTDGHSRGGPATSPIEQHNNAVEEDDVEEESISTHARILKTCDKNITQTPKLSQSELQDAVNDVIAHLSECTGRAFDAGGSQTRHLRERLSGGAGIDDCKALIDHRVALWYKDARMTGYLRPETLFAKRHFANYLQLAREWDRAGRPAIQPNGPTLHPSGHTKAHNVAPIGKRREDILDQWHKMSE